MPIYDCGAKDCKTCAEAFRAGRRANRKTISDGGTMMRVKLDDNGEWKYLGKDTAQKREDTIKELVDCLDEGLLFSNGEPQSDKRRWWSKAHTLVAKVREGDDA